MIELGTGFSHTGITCLSSSSGSFSGAGPLRGQTNITTAHAKRSNQLGFGDSAVVRSTLSKANMLREPRIFDEYAFYMVSLAQKRRITKEFELHGRIYAVDSTTNDLSRFFAVNLCGAFFIIKEKGRHGYEIVDGEELLEGDDGILLDQRVRFTGKRNAGNYPSEIRRIVYYAADLGSTFVYYTNNVYFPAKDIALLYRYRWQVELFFKWIKQHLRVKRFWGDSENAVRIQIHVAIITYCLVAIIEHDLHLGRPVFEVMRILGSSLLVKDNLLELFG